MGSSVIFLLSSILLIFSNQVNGQSKQLIAGHVLYRHGDRTPITTFPTDPVKPDQWPNGFGQLTAAGIEQQHRLGGFIRERYGSLLSPIYHPSEFVVRSTDIDRTLMSAQSNLAGLYPALNATPDKIPIQPIPIHTVSLNVDFLLGQNDCPRYDQIEDEVDHSAEVVAMNAYYQPFFEKLQQWTNVTNITVYNAWDIADTVFVEHIYNKTPEWATPEVRQNLSDVNDLAFHYLFANNDSNRIRGGPLIQDVWLNINKSVSGAGFKKVKMYSAHDTTVSAVLAFLDINYPHQPQYASALFVDLYQQNSSYFVRVEYLNVTDSRVAYPYVLNGCPASDCPLQTFTNIYQPRFPATADIECARKEPNGTTTTTTITTIITTTTTTTMVMTTTETPDGGNGHLILVLVIAIISLVALIFIIFLCLYLRKTDHDLPLLGGSDHTLHAI